MANRKDSLELSPFQKALKCRVHSSSTHDPHEGVSRWFPGLATIKIHTQSLLSVWSKTASGSKGIWQITHGGNSSLKTCLSFIPAETQIPRPWLKHCGVSQKERLKYHRELKLNLKRRTFGMKFLFLLHYLVRSCTTLLLQDHCVPLQMCMLV